MKNHSECGHCGEEFQDGAALVKHIKEVHIMKRRQENQIPSDVIEKAEQQLQSPPPEKISPPAPPPLKAPPEPLKLKYQWTGMCEKGHTVKTIEIENETSNSIVAYCISCDKEVKKEKVIPLYEQPKILGNRN